MASVRATARYIFILLDDCVLNYCLSMGVTVGLVSILSSPF